MNRASPAGRLAALGLALALGVLGLSPGAAQVRVLGASHRAAPETDPEVSTIYRGTLGDERVQMTLTPKPSETGGYSGEYFVFGGGRNILLAGEVDGESFFLEESEDGTAVSGTWDGQFVVEEDRGYVVGTWHNADETLSKAFRLERVLKSRNHVKRIA
jgi:hypothetical protein